MKNANTAPLSLLVALVPLAIGALLPACTTKALLGSDDANEERGSDGDDEASADDGQTSSISGDDEQTSDASAGEAGDGGADGAGDVGTGGTGGDAVPFEQRCPSVAAQSVQCIVTTDQAIVAIGLDLADICVIDDANGWDTSDSIPFIPQYGALEWVGETLESCHALDESSTFQRYNLTTRVSETSDAPCLSMTSNDSGVYFRPDAPGNVRFAPDFAAAFAGDVGTDTGIAALGNRFAANEDRLWIADPEAGAAVPYALPSGEQLPTVTFEGADQFIAGMTVLNGSLVVIQGDEVVMFGSETGTLTSAFMVGGYGQLHAVACRVKPPV